MKEVLTGWMREIRRTLHMHPELSLQEFETAGRIERWLDDLGVPHRRVAGTGVVAEVGDRSDGPLVALRCETDALPVREETGLPFASAVEGRMHACGHDGHTAIALGAVRLLQAQRERLPGRVRVLFQPAEEIFAGARALMEAGALEGVRAIFALHNHPGLPAGVVACREGALTAASDRLRITVRGEGGHGAMPHHCRDPILGAAAVITALQSVVSRATDPLEPLVISICRIQGGSVFNVIPAEVELEGTMRSLSALVRDRAAALLAETARNAARAQQVEAEVEVEAQCPALVNDPGATSIVRRAAAEVVGPDRVITIPPLMVAEDFAFYLERMPGSYFYLGSGSPEPGVAHQWHHPRFDLEERVLATGAEVMARVALRALRAV